VAAAPGKNGGAFGIAPKCRILAVKTFHADFLASDARVADAIRYAALHANILSCSRSGSVSPDIELARMPARWVGTAKALRCFARLAMISAARSASRHRCPKRLPWVLPLTKGSWPPIPT
jgi:hypothetical protein